jgi:hypothetical protein
MLKWIFKVGCRLQKSALRVYTHRFHMWVQIFLLKCKLLHFDKLETCIPWRGLSATTVSCVFFEQLRLAERGAKFCITVRCRLPQQFAMSLLCWQIKGLVPYRCGHLLSMTCSPWKAQPPPRPCSYCVSAVWALQQECPIMKLNSLCALVSNHTLQFRSQKISNDAKSHTSLIIFHVVSPLNVGLPSKSFPIHH